MANLCSICLSQDRILNCKDDLIPVLEYLTPELHNLVPALNICWECETLLKKCSKLRKQILKAHAVHTSLNIKKEIDVEPPAVNLENQKSLSTLAIKHNSGFDFIYNCSHTDGNSASCLKRVNFSSNTQPDKIMNIREIAESSSNLSVNDAGTSTAAVADEVANEDVFIKIEPVECDVIIKNEPDSDDNPDNSDYNSDNSDDNFDKSDDDVPSKRRKALKRSLPTTEISNKKFVNHVKNTKEDFERSLNDSHGSKCDETAPNMSISNDNINKSVLSMDIDGISNRLAKNLESKEFVIECMNTTRRRIYEFPFVKVKPQEFSLPSDEDILYYFNESMKKALICEDVASVTISVLSDAEAAARRKILAAKSYVYMSSKFKCVKCLLGYPTKTEFEDHKRNKHIQENKLKTELCPICQSYIDKSLFTLHYGRHRVQYTCTICQKQTAEIVDMRSHLREHYDKVEEPNDCYCGICYTQFKSNHNLRVHNSLRHGGPKVLKKSDKSKRQYKCTEPGCNAKFMHSNKLEHHIKLVHDELTFCHLCDKMLASEISLKRHIVKFHKKKKKAK